MGDLYFDSELEYQAEYTRIVGEPMSIVPVTSLRDLQDFAQGEAEKFAFKRHDYSKGDG